ncbi:MAG: GNAT family N-acetyltransferase [Candidatus Limnocylindrales bacterium]
MRIDRADPSQAGAAAGNPASEGPAGAVAPLPDALSAPPPSLPAARHVDPVELEHPMAVAPATLEGAVVRLEPLSQAHLDGLAEVAIEPSLWEFTIARIHSRDDLRRWLDGAIRARVLGSELPFVTVELAGGRPIGSSRYLNIDRSNRRLEIGWTWVAPAWQRSAVNTEAKLLMLEHAFERLGCHRVEFKTDSRNERSRRALLRIGARQEGIFRNHVVMPDGQLRHSVYFSIVDEEWPAVKTALQAKLLRAG